MMTKAFAAHCDLKMKNASSLGVKGEETLAEMQLLAGWVAEARERGEERRMLLIVSRIEGESF